jgi:hypothetical protein
MAFCRTYGKCHVVSLPMGIDRAFREALSNYPGTVLRNAVVWAAGGPAALQAAGDGLLDVALWGLAGPVTAHLVNLTNPMAMTGPYHQIFPVRPFRVQIDLAEGARVKAARLLVVNHAAPMRTSRTAGHHGPASCECARSGGARWTCARAYCFASQLRMAAFTSAGRSSMRKWPVSGIRTS